MMKKHHTPVHNPSLPNNFDCTISHYVLPIFCYNSIPAGLCRWSEF